MKQLVAGFVLAVLAASIGVNVYLLPNVARVDALEIQVHALELAKVGLNVELDESRRDTETELVKNIRLGNKIAEWESYGEGAKVQISVLRDKIAEWEKYGDDSQSAMAKLRDQLVTAQSTGGSADIGGLIGLILPFLIP